ncbi:winged helix DNA-binding domain-containing protein [Streptomyces sp. TX20-6-3]|uniref:winged helix DNA-binding domain-containing protein n=1 Tax=Streptomyces sp. TX20-6-3 TaxID=3028705 RepID=UPI0029BC3AC4|nr:winged helix DNA-binding domain-containing protein [Streptomyces sp. TX20-6-3]MDX2564737.1 winged helix DNA-binding domain-containing protein [Streptomyces sp. TX20-6-3]
MALKTTHPVLGARALNRATLDRQLLLRPASLGVTEAVEHLLGLQAQNTKPPYYALAARLEGFRPEQLSALMESRDLARIVTMRSTVHTHTARDAVALRGLTQGGAIDRELALFVSRGGLDGVDLDRLAELARALVAERPRTPKELREELLPQWPDADPQSLSVAARCLLPLVQVTPRGLWGRGGQVALTTTDQWFDDPADGAADLDETVLRYLGAFGPASVKDMQTWCGLTKLGPAFERLRPRLLVFQDERGTELFDLPDAPRPDEDTPAPPRLLPEFDNLLLSHADRSRVVPRELKGRTWTGNQAHRVFLLDGFLAGLWRLDEGKDRTTLTIEPFAHVTRAQRIALTSEAERTLRLMSPPGTPYDIVLAES